MEKENFFDKNKSDLSVFSNGSDSQAQSNEENDNNLINEAMAIAESTQKIIDPAASFYSEFSDGYTFRNLIEYIRITNFSGTIKCYPGEITYIQSNEDGTVLNKFEIQTYQLTDYQFTSRTNEILIPVNMVKFRNVTKNVGKKDRCSILKMPNDGTLYVQIFNANSQSNGEPSGIFPVETHEFVGEEYEEPYCSQPEDQPNCAIYQAEFSKMCASMNSVKSNYVMAHGMEKGIIFKGIKADGTTAYIKDFGKVRQQEEKKIHYNLRNLDKLGVNANTKKPATVPTPKLRIGESGEIRKFSISMSTIKGLAKLNNLSPMGTIKVYIRKDEPLRFICNIGCYGKLTIYIQSLD
jgi:hypothetical protein